MPHPIAHLVQAVQSQQKGNSERAVAEMASALRTEPTTPMTTSVDALLDPDTAANAMLLDLVTVEANKFRSGK